MALGRAQIQRGFQDPREILGDRLREGSLYRLLADHGHRMFPDDYFAGLYTGSARARPARPRRLFEDTKVTAKAAGAMKGRARVLDSTPVYDAVATQDTVTQLRAAIRKVLSALDQAASPVAAAVRRALRRDDDYASPGKPPCDWDDPAAREVLVDELVNDALAALGAR